MLLALLNFPTAEAFAQTGPSNLNISGTLFQPGGLPVTNSGVHFRLEVWDKNSTCLLYSEQHLNEDLSQTKGAFALILGRGTSPTNYLESSAVLTNKVFQNTGVVAGGWAGCASGTTLAAGDERVVRINYDLGGGYVAMTPDVPVASAPYSMVAETLQGKTPADLVQLRDDATYDLTQANVENVFSATNYSRLIQLLNTGAALGMNGQRLTNVGTPTGATDAATKGYTDTNLGGKTIDLVDVGTGTGNGKVLTWDAAQSKWVATAVTATASGSAGGDLSGTYPNPSVAANAITSAKINSTGVAVNRLLITDGVTGASVTYKTCANNEILKYITGTGWDCATVGSLSPVTSVAGKTGVVALNAGDISGLGTASLRDYGTSANQLVQLDSGAKIPSAVIPDLGGDLSGTLGTSYVKGLQGRTVANIAPNPAEVLTWNGSAWIPSATGTSSQWGTASTNIYYSTGNVGIGTSSPAVTLDLGSRKDALRLPSGNATTDRPGTPANGMIRYNSVANRIEGYENGAWTNLSATGAGSGDFKADGSVPMTGALLSTAGSTSAPGVSFVGDTDNGLFAPAADNLAFTTAGSEKIRVLANGRVGIGTSTPLGSFQIIRPGETSVTNSTSTWNNNYFFGDISNTSVNYGAVNIQGNAGGIVNLWSATTATPVIGSLKFNFATRSTTAENTARVAQVTAEVTDYSSTAGGVLVFGTRPAGGANILDRMRIDSLGNVGIGVTASRMLHVGGPIRIDPATLPSSPAAGDLAFDSSAANALKFYDGGTWQTVGTGSGSGDFKSDGSVSMTAGLRAFAGTAALPGYTFSGDLDTGVWAPSADTVALSTAGSERLRISSTGYLGVGTTSPTGILDVQGGTATASSNGSNISLIAQNGGTTGNTAGGSVNITAGNANGNGVSGNVNITGGSNVSLAGGGGNVVISGGAAASGNKPGGVTITGGTASSSWGAPVTIAASAAVANNPGGTLSLSSGATINGSAGPINIAAGGGGFSGVGGNINLTAGTGGTSSGNAGSIVLTAGTTSGSGTAGNIQLFGNVGIGTTNPTDSLNVYNSSNGAKGIVIDNASTGNIARAALSLRNNSGQIASVFANSSTATDTGAAMASSMTIRSPYANGINLAAADPLGRIRFYTGDDTSAAERMRIDSAGNVGIGISNPQRLLHLAGPIRINPAALPSSPAAGDLAFDSASSNALKFYDGSSWQSVGSGSASLSNFTEALNQAAPNASRPVVRLSANNASTNVDVALSPKGSGAIIARLSDASASGGNKRGQYAVDLSLSGSSAGYVASGDYSVSIGGENLTAAGQGAVTIGGSINAANGTDSVALAGLSNIAGSARSAIIAGSSNVTGGAGGSVILGGTGNSVAGTYGVAGGNNVTALAYNQTTFGAFNLPKGGENGGTWVSTDPLFVIGNGTGVSSLRSTAFMVLKNGNIGIGITAPNRLLDVAGPMHITPAALPSSPAAGDLAFDSAASNALKFYDGTTWQTAGGGAGSGDFKADGSVSMTAGLRAFAGTAALPGLTISGDLDTGVWAPAANTLAISTGGIERMRVLSSGNVGIGTTAPGTTFHVKAGSSGTGTSSVTGLFVENSSSSNSNYVLQTATGPGIGLTVTSAGYVGVGIAPTHNFEVTHAVGSVYVDSDGLTSVGAVGAGNLNLSGNSTSSGNTLGMVLFTDRTTSSTSAGASIRARATQVWSAGKLGTALEFYTTPTNSGTTQKIMVIDQNGYVGIGATAPGAKLEVGGTAGTDGIKFPDATLQTTALGSEIVVTDEKASGTAGGTCTSGSWLTRTLNTVRTNTIASASLASNRISLPAGTYSVEATAPAYGVGLHKALLYNVTAASNLLIGTSETSNTTDPTQSSSVIVGTFTLAVASDLELQHRCASTLSTSGFGQATSFGVTEVYSQVHIIKIK